MNHRPVMMQEQQYIHGNLWRRKRTGRTRERTKVNNLAMGSVNHDRELGNVGDILDEKKKKEQRDFDVPQLGYDTRILDIWGSSDVIT